MYLYKKSLRCERRVQVDLAVDVFVTNMHNALVQYTLNVWVFCSVRDSFCASILAPINASAEVLHQMNARRVWPLGVLASVGNRCIRHGSGPR